MLGHWLSTACSYLESASNLHTEGTGVIIFITSPAWESEYYFSRQKLMFATYYISVALPQDSGNARTKKSTCVGFKRHRPKFYLNSAHSFSLHVHTTLKWDTGISFNYGEESLQLVKRRFSVSADTKPQSHACQYWHLRELHTRNTTSVLHFTLTLR